MKITKYLLVLIVMLMSNVYCNAIDPIAPNYNLERNKFTSQETDNLALRRLTSYPTGYYAVAVHLVTTPTVNATLLGGATMNINIVDQQIVLIVDATGSTVCIAGVISVYGSTVTLSNQHFDIGGSTVWVTGLEVNGSTVCVSITGQQIVLVVDATGSSVCISGLVNVYGSTVTLSNDHFDVGGSTVWVAGLSVNGSTVSITNTNFDVGGSTIYLAGLSVNGSTTTPYLTVTDVDVSKYTYSAINGKLTGITGTATITYYGYGKSYSLRNRGTTEISYISSWISGTGYIDGGNYDADSFDKVSISSPTTITLTLTAGTTVDYAIGGYINR